MNFFFFSLFFVAIAEMQGKMIDDLKITVSIAQPKKIRGDFMQKRYGGDNDGNGGNGNRSLMRSDGGHGGHGGGRHGRDGRSHRGNGRHHHHNRNNNNNGGHGGGGNNNGNGACLVSKHCLATSVTIDIYLLIFYFLF